MDEAWERAVEAALRGGGGGGAPPEGSSAEAASSSSSSLPRSLTLDGVIKCLHGRLPSSEILERYQTLEHLSVANIGVSSLEGFPKLRNLTRLSLSDNRISTGLEHLVEAGLDSLRDLDLSNNRIGSIEDLAPLARLKLVSLDLYECPVTRVKDYRPRVFGLIRSLKYLDKMDADENERPESDEEEDDDEEEGEEEEEEEEDPGSGEVDGEEMVNGSVPGMANGNGLGVILDGDEDESEEEEGVEMVNGLEPGMANGFRVVPVRAEEQEEVDDESEDEVDLGEEIDEEEEEEEEDVVEVLDVSDDDDDDDEGEEMDDGDGGGEIDGHERGEEEDEDENGEIGEEETAEGLVRNGNGFEELDDRGGFDEGDGEDDDEDDDDDDEDEDTGTDYHVQISQQAEETVESDFDPNEIAEADEEEEEADEIDQADDHPEPPTSQINKRKHDDNDDDDDGDGGGGGDYVDDFRSVRSRH